MQDVCISFWNESGHSDMMLKVTDICSTDENDPSHCATPYDIKIDRTKSRIMQNFPDPTDPHISGHQFPGKVWWFFMKCWDDVCSLSRFPSAKTVIIANWTLGHCSTRVPGQQLVHYTGSSEQSGLGPVRSFEAV